MKILWTVVIIVVGVVLLGMLFMGGAFRDYSQYMQIKEPRIIAMPAQKMLVVKSTGDHNIAGKGAFSELFKTLFKLKKEVKGVQMSPPRARWPQPFNTPKEQWIGIYALPIPAEVTTLPAQDANAKYPATIEEWKYGEVAEILHIGSYEDETPTIERLHKFINDKGYKITGPHEEEYIRGPELIFRSPKNYLTIIRYEVKKK